MSSAQCRDKRLNIPVVLFLFKRSRTAPLIMDRLRQVKPHKIYLMADQGRNEAEIELAMQSRRAFEEEINWDCTVIKCYADENRGVFRNIGLGALNVFEHEDAAIFLEDDNLPEPSFFWFCEEMLDRYRNNDEVLWVCGTNYLGDDSDNCQASYAFTQSLLPCGWASWASKFSKYYDAYFEKYMDPKGFLNMKRSYRSSALFRQQRRSIEMEVLRYSKGLGFRSWDYQMISSIRANGLYGIVPSRNQIKNIGVDALSEHGGSSSDDVMTRRFCGIDSYPIEFPLTHPERIEIDYRVEGKLDEIILQPIGHRLKGMAKLVLLKVRGC